jgi:hypothetical protein
MSKQEKSCKSKRDLGLDFLEIKQAKIKKSKKKIVKVNKGIKYVVVLYKFRTKRSVKESKIVNITVQKDQKNNDDASTCYNYEVEENRTRTLEDYQKSKSKKKPKIRQNKIKLNLKSARVTKSKSHKEIKKYMESQQK